MQYTSRLALRPLIGLSAKIKQTSNHALHRITGVILDDTQNMLTLFDGHRTRHVSKASCLFELSLPNGETVEIPGKALLGHPAERLRRAKKLQW